MNKSALKELPNFTGTEHYYHNNIPRFVYTDGAKFLADNADAQWLLVEIGLAQNLPVIRNDASLQRHQFWTLKKNEPIPAPTPGTVGAVLHAAHTQPKKGMATLICERDLGDVAYTKQIHFTDFPFDAMGEDPRIWVAPTCVGDEPVQVAYLPSEH